MREGIDAHELRAWRNHAAAAPPPPVWTTRSMVFQHLAKQAKAAVVAVDPSAGHPRLGPLRAASSVLPIAGLLPDHSPWLMKADGNRFTGAAYRVATVQELCGGTNAAFLPDAELLADARDVFFDMVLPVAVGIDAVRQTARRDLALPRQPAIVRKVMDAAFDDRGEARIREALLPSLWTRANHDVLEQGFVAAVEAFAAGTAVSFVDIRREFATFLVSRIELVRRTPDVQDDEQARSALDALHDHVTSVAGHVEPLPTEREHNGDATSWRTFAVWDLENLARDHERDLGMLTWGALAAEELTDSDLPTGMASELVDLARAHLMQVHEGAQGRPAGLVAAGALAVLAHAEEFQARTRGVAGSDQPERGPGTPEPGTPEPGHAVTWMEFIEHRLAGWDGAAPGRDTMDVEDVLDATVWALATVALTQYAAVLADADAGTVTATASPVRPSGPSRDDEGPVR